MSFRTLLLRVFARLSLHSSREGAIEDGETADFETRYRAAVATLPELDHEVFWRHSVVGDPIDEIARSLDLPVTEIEGRLAAAIVGIEDALDRLR